MTLGKTYISPKLIIGILLILFFAVSLIFRVVLPYDHIFTPDGIKYSSNDAYYHMRIVDSIVHNFPHATQMDPYYLYPTGGLTGPSFFDWLIALVVLVLGLGSPSPHLIDTVGVLFPAVMGALLIIPVYFIGKNLFNRWVGVIAAGLIAILPGEFMGRSIIGFTDNHIAEVFFSTIAVMFLTFAIKSAGEKQLSFNNLIHFDWKTVRKPLIFSALAGLFLGIYLITWLGAPLFVFILMLFFVIQFIINHLKHKPVDPLCIVGFITFLIALIIFLPFSTYKDMSFGMVGALLIPPVMGGISLWMSKRGLKVWYYPLVIIVIAILAIGVFRLAMPETFTSAVDKFKTVFIPSGSTAATTLEMQPFLSPSGKFETRIAWGNYTTSFFLFPGVPIPGFAIISLVILLYLFIRKHNDKENWPLFILWTLVIAIATLIQRRFAYYLVVNIAVLSAYISWELIWLAGVRRISEKTEATAAAVAQQTMHKTAFSKKKQPAKPPKKSGVTIYHINAALAAVVVIVLVFVFNIVKAKEVASAAPYAPSDAWQTSLLWLKDNSPEPLGDIDAYYKSYKPNATYTYDYPATAYGVTSWWDYGYWISRIAHRIPNSNPSQDAWPIQNTAIFFLSDNASARQAFNGFGSRYIIADYSMVTTKFWAILNWAGRNQSDFLETYYVEQDSKINPVQVLTPAYYQSLLVRLYVFDGKAVTTPKPTVITFADKTTTTGKTIKLISDAQQFETYQEAVDYVNQHGAANNKIVGTDPFVCPIPLDALTDYELVYGSDSTVKVSDTGFVSEVKIFQFIGKK
jgi:oligosaccharyl transferase (archaeosortase A-associated)